MTFYKVEKEYYVWLANALGAGSKYVIPLLSRFGDPERVYNATPDDYADIVTNDARTLEALCDKRLSEALDIVEYCRKDNVTIIPIDSSLYPQSFMTLENPPLILYCKGRLVDFNAVPLITMVGSRTCTSEGVTMAYTYGYKCTGYGATVVSGAAKGIDAAAMKGALNAGGIAIGFLANGIDRIYPAENSELFGRLYSEGLLVTEFPPYTKPLGVNFPIRNRLLACISDATVVFEGDLNSGAMITAKYAEKYGKPLFATPGNPLHKPSAGPNFLIKSGVTATTQPWEIMDALLYLYPHAIKVPKNPETTPEASLPIPADIIKYSTLNTRVAVADGIVYEPPMHSVGYSAERHEEKTHINDPSLSKPANSHTKVKHILPMKETAREAAREQALEKERLLREKANATSPIPTVKKKVHSSYVASISEEIEGLIGEIGLSVLECIEKGVANTCDSLAEKTGADISQILTALTLLETTGIIEQKPGGIFEIIP